MVALILWPYVEVDCVPLTGQGSLSEEYGEAQALRTLLDVLANQFLSSIQHVLGDGLKEFPAVARQTLQEWLLILVLNPAGVAPHGSTEPCRSGPSW